MSIYTISLNAFATGAVFVSALHSSSTVLATILVVLGILNGLFWAIGVGVL